MTLELVVRETGRHEPDAAVIWLHGLGADAHDFEPAVPLLDLGPGRPLRFLFPNAPVRPVTLNAGMRMRAWYDLGQLESGGAEDEAGIRQAAAAIGELLAGQVAAGITSERIVLAGFSQGGATALFSAVRYPHKLAGVVALSCYLPLPDSLETELSPANRDTPIFFGHGKSDPVVAASMGRASCERLRSAGCNVQWHSYHLPHSVSPEELADVRAFLDSCLPAVSGAA